MLKAKKQIIEDLKLVDIVIELLDARIPISSRNPDIQEITKNKKKIIVLNKCDLSNEKENQKWISYFESKGEVAILTDANSGYGIQNLMMQIENLTQEQQSKMEQRGRSGRKIKAMILGIPNVGKSSLINRISKKTSANVGNKPGVTKQKQWIRINEKVELLDTPGVLWPKFENEEVAMHLSFTGTIKEEILDKVEVAYQLIKFLLENYKEELYNRYKLDQEYIEKDLGKDAYQVMLEIGKKRGCIISGGNIDEEKVSRLILDEFKNGIIGRITIEKR